MNDLSFTLNEPITLEDELLINKMVEKTIEKYKNNSAQVAKQTIDSITSLAVSTSRLDEIESQSFLKRTFWNLTGKNKDLEMDIMYSHGNAQHAAQLTLSKLAEQNLLTFDLLTAVNSKLNAYMISNEIETNEIYSTLIRFIKETRGKFLRFEHRVDYLNQRIELLKWAQTAEYALFDEWLYNDLDTASKILCLTSDFYSVSKGNWDTTDLLLIKSVLKDLGEEPNQEVSVNYVLDKFIDNTSMRKLMGSVMAFDKIKSLSPLEIPIIYSFYKAEKFLNDEKYLVHTLSDYLNSVEINKNEKELIRTLTLNYVDEHGLRDLTIEQPIFELMNELLIEIKVLNDSIDFEEDASLSEPQYQLGPEDVKFFDVTILDYKMDKIELTNLLSEVLETDASETSVFLDDDKLIHRIASGVTINKARDISDALNEIDVESIITSVEEPLQIVSLDISKTVLASKDWKFDFSKYVQPSFQIEKLEAESVVNPYSIITAIKIAGQYEIFQANVNGEVVKLFQDVNHLIIEEHNNNSRIPLFCIKTKRTQLDYFERQVLNSVPESEIYVNRLIVEDF